MIVDLDFLLFGVMLGVLSVVRSFAMVASNNTIVFQFGPTATSFKRRVAAPGFRYREPGFYLVVLGLPIGFVLRIKP